jgi:hypothetical protein
MHVCGRLSTPVHPRRPPPPPSILADPRPPPPTPVLPRARPPTPGLPPPPTTTTTSPHPRQVADYVADCRDLPVRSAVHVETCVGQVEGGYPLDPVAETRFVAESMAGEPLWGGRPYAIVPFVHLARPDAEAVMDAHLAAVTAGGGCGGVVGVRMITSWDDADPTLCWPQVRLLVGGGGGEGGGAALACDRVWAQVGRGDFMSGKDEAFERG